MKIGVVVDNELNHDIRVLREIEILKEQGYEISVLCFGFRKKYLAPADGISITRIRIDRKIKDILFFFLNTLPLYEWFWASKIENFIVANGIEILHVHDLYMSRAAHKGITKTQKKVPLVLDLHENYPFAVTTYNWTKGFIRSLISRPEEWRKKEKEYLGYADRIIVLSNEFRDLLINRYPELSEDTFVTLPNVPDLSRLQNKSAGAPKNLFKESFSTIFYYGVIAERRGVFDALRVFINLVKENYFVNFLLIGPVDKKDKTRFLNLINLELLANRVYYIPWIDSAELSAYLEISDICIAPFHKNPQHESGVANKIYDYMLGKKPIIASDCLPQQKLIEKYNCGIIFRNETELTEALIKLLGDTGLGKELGENGYNAILKDHHTGVIKDNFVKMYLSIKSTTK